MEFSVFIPTRGRLGLSQQITLRELRDFSTVRPTLVCPEDEVKHHLKYHDSVMACPAENINTTHQWILENSPTRGAIMLDDDQYFSKRRGPDFAPRPLDRVSNKDLDTMFLWISDQLDNGYAHGGISARQGNQHILYPHTDCIRANNAHFFDTEVFRREGLALPAEPVMHDFYFTLALIERGYPNRVGYHFCWSQRGSGTKGGCSLYRTPELQRQWCETLQREFPDVVRIVTKTTTSGGGLFAGDRVDVNIQWIKAWARRDPKLRLFTDYTPNQDPFLKRRPLAGEEGYEE